ncbi:MAG: DUF1553 domain-containing protein [Planctomycetes bacterium]|nr:DUF1553 domain-containing protein [Planctomycetota bacterium]
MLLSLLFLAALGGDPPPARASHWAYRAPVRAPLPAEAFPGWARNPLDRFVAERLAREGLAPAPEATPEALLRRAALDLTGLPPTPAELDLFRADRAPDAYGRALDRLLASPHYGEHQARAWLDLARYADSRGYEKDERREMWRYRDWVIEAFDRDLAFDQFTLEQLAGDLLPEPTLEQLVATGFQRNTLVNEEGGTDPEEFRVAAVKDRVHTTALAWLGTTLECAQCHDHKYDPFTQLDYYRLFAFFDSTEDSGNSDAPSIPAPTRVFAARAVELEAERAGIERELAPEVLASTVEAWRARWAEATWTVLHPSRFAAREGSRLALLADESVLALGAPPAADVYELATRLGPGTIRALRLEVLTDPSLPEQGPGRSEQRNFVLGRVALTLDGAPLAVVRARADYSQDEYGPAGVLDDDPHSGWAIGGALGEGHALVLELAEPLVLTRAAELALELEQHYGAEHLFGRFRLSASAVALPAEELLPSPEIAALLAAPDVAQRERMGRWYAERAPALAPRRERRAAIERELVPPQALVMRERAEPRHTFVQLRGNFLAPGAEVTPAVPAILPPLAELGRRATRLDLARWLVSAENPLTARVTVNRFWQRLFGTGLVATDNDFGLRGELPSHPELLDWLALEFQQRGWSVKQLLRLILESATYRQSSRVTAELVARDPANRLLARGPKLRLDAEVLRDVALAASGLLCATVGGPSVFPPQPEGIWQSPYSGDSWPASSACDAHRRGLYTFLKRSAPYPTFQLFDATSREFACSRRERSNTPLQALALLDDPVFVECQRALAARMCAEGGDTDEARVRLGFRLSTAREPAASELAVLLRLLASERAAADAESTPEHAWFALACVLLNLDETVTKS